MQFMQIITPICKIFTGDFTHVTGAPAPGWQSLWQCQAASLTQMGIMNVTVTVLTTMIMMEYAESQSWSELGHEWWSLAGPGWNSLLILLILPVRLAERPGLTVASTNQKRRTKNVTILQWQKSYKLIIIKFPESLYIMPQWWPIF